MAKFTQKDLLEGYEFNFSNTKQQYCLFDGCGTVFRGQHIIMPYLEHELNLISYKFVEVSTVCNLSVTIANSPDKNMNFSSNDMRLFNPFLLFTRKKMISVYPDGFCGPMWRCKTITLQIPDFTSFNYLSYIAESLVEFFKLAMQLKKDLDFTPSSKCKIPGCNSEAMYYPSICSNHFHYLSKVSLKSFLTDKNTKISYRDGQIGVFDVLEVIVDGYINHSYDIGTEECIVCGYKSNKLTYGFCGYCSGIIDLASMQADLNNSVLTAKDILAGEWKQYFMSNEGALKAFIKDSQARRAKNEVMEKAKREALKEAFNYKYEKVDWVANYVNGGVAGGAANV